MDAIATKHVFSFEEGDGKDKKLLGGKGANLAEMSALGIPVPPGFTITTEACNAFYDEGGLPKAVDEQMDGSRELPAATGVIDLKSFLGALVQIGYDGPVRAEPFNKKLRDMDNEPAMAATAAAMKKAFALVS